jgi:hypothetical protein
VDYKQGDYRRCSRADAGKDQSTGRRPGIIVVPRVVGGATTSTREPGAPAGRGGYVGFALDMYGKGKVARTPDDAMKFMGEATKDSGAW